VGRTPEYWCKKIEQKEVKMAMLSVLVAALSILGFSAFGSVAHFPEDSYINPPGPTTANQQKRPARIDSGALCL